MQLALSFPPPWVVTRIGASSRAILRNGDGVPTMVVDYGGLSLLAEDRSGWLERMMRSNLPVEHRLELGRHLDERTATGWPVRLVRAEVFDENGRRIERRLAACYSFFEHAGFALVIGPDATFDHELDDLEPVLLAATPDFSGEPACLHHFWDLRPPRPEPDALDETANVVDELAAIETALDAGISAPLHLAQARLLRQLGRLDEARTALAAAAALTPDDAAISYQLGLTLAQEGRGPEGLQAWETAIRLDPTMVEAWNHAGQMYCDRGDFESAYERWQHAAALTPEDFFVQHRLLQVLNRLDRYDEAATTHDKLLELWRRSDDPRVHLVDELVIDNFALGAITVAATETFRPLNSNFYAIYSFRTFDTANRALALIVLLETSDFARSRGTPFVLTQWVRGDKKTIAVSATQPSYAELKRRVMEIVAAYAS